MSNDDVYRFPGLQRYELEAQRSMRWGPVRHSADLAESAYHHRCNHQSQGRRPLPVLPPNTNDHMWYLATLSGRLRVHYLGTAASLHVWARPETPHLRIVALEVVGSNPIGYPHERIPQHDASNADVLGVRGVMTSAREALSMMQHTEHLYIVTDDSILHGEPIIIGTRTLVRAIVELWRQGIAPETIPAHLPHLMLAQGFDALSYYSDHQDEINGYIARNRIPETMIDPLVRA